MILWILPKFLTVRIEPWEIGVRRSLTGGITERDFAFGYQLRLPFIHSYYRLPRTLQYLNYVSTGQPGDQGALEIRTSGNNVIFVDISVPWRIKEGEAWQIVREGFIDTYGTKVQSTTTGVLRSVLAQMTNLTIYDSDKRIAVADSITPVLNKELAQYHVVAEQVVIRAIRFRKEYESKLQNKQLFIVQGKLDEALRKESVAKQDTETLEKTIDKEMSLKREEWNKKIEELRTRLELQIAAVEAEAVQYDRKKRSEADAFFTEAKAEGDLAEAKAEALGEKLKARALASRAGRTYSAITAVENFPARRNPAQLKRPAVHAALRFDEGLATVLLGSVTCSSDLFCLLPLAGGLWAAYAWWRNARAQLGDGDETGLGIGEFERLRKLAKRHPRIDQAIKLRINIVAAGDEESKASLSVKVDSALRRLGEQVTLHERIGQALENIDRDRLAREATGARAQADTAEPDDSVHALADQLQLQLEQVDRLTERRRALDNAADRIVLLLGNLNLALLEAASSRATDDADKVHSVLSSLEDAKETVRQTTDAEEEISRFLKASQITALAQR